MTKDLFASNLAEAHWDFRPDHTVRALSTARFADRPAAPAVVRMRREATGAISLHISNVRIERDAAGAEASPIAGELAGWGADRETTLAAVGEFRRDGAALALVVRFPVPAPKTLDAPASRPASGLPKWRLKRATDYIEANLAEPIGLSDLAAVAGLSPAYFAAQFRASTGLRPHEYLLRRRIHHAQRLLLDLRMSVVEVALDVGFQTQAHFTTVFKRFVGDTPCHWRRRNYVDA
jgi:AraC-like DNA-binding protein